MSSLQSVARPLRVIVRAVVLALVATTLALGLGGTVAQAAPTLHASGDDPVRTQPTLGVDGSADATGLISGLVYDQDGNLLDNIEVEAFSSADPGGEPVASDLTYEYENAASHGAYVLHVPAGDYLVRFSSPAFEDNRVYETAFYGGDAGTPVTVADGAQVALDDVALARDTGAPVTGVVLDADGHPVADAEVDLVRIYSASDDDYSFIDTTYTDATGHYTFAGVNRGRPYTVRASTWGDGGWSPFMFLGQQVNVLQATTFTLPAGSTGRTLDPITLPRGTAITGTVTGPTGNPIDDGEVYLYVAAPDGELSYVGYADGIGDDGSFRLTGAPGFTYTVGFYSYSDTDPGTTYLGDTHDEDTAHTFTLGTDPTDVGAIHVGVTGSRVSVTVLDASGEPTPDADVAVWRKTATGLRRVDYLYSQDGTYSRRLDWGGEYTFSAQPYGSATSYFLGGGTTAEGARLVVPAQTEPTVDAGTITIPTPARGRFRGVVSGGDAPLAGAEVRLYGRYSGCEPSDPADASECWDSLTQTTTRDDGTYSLGIRDWMRSDYATLTIRASKADAGYSTRYAGGASNIGDATTYEAPAVGEATTVDLSLELYPGQARGSFVLAGGAPVTDGTDATLYCWNAVDERWDSVGSAWTESSQYSVPTDGDHAFCLVQLSSYTEEGTWRGASVDGEWPTGEAIAGTPGVFAVTADGITEVPEITLKAPSRLNGTLTSATGTPLDGYFGVRLYRWTEWGWDAWDYTGSETPAYSFDDVGAGTYAVRVTYYPSDGGDSVTTWSGNGLRPSGPEAPGTVTVGTGGGEVVHLDVVVGQRPVIHGTVVDASGPVAGAHVVLVGTYCDGCWADHLAAATTAADGSYDVPIEDYWTDDGYDRFTVSAEKASAGYTTTWLGDTADETLATMVPFTSSADPVAPITLAVQPNTLVVRTTTEDSGSLEGSTSLFEIYRWNDESGELGYVTQDWADDGGALAINGLDAGRYAIVVINTTDDGDSRYLRTWYGGGRPHSATDPGLIEVGGADNPAVATVDLQRGVGLSGVVTAGEGADQAPVEGASISVAGTSVTNGPVEAWSTSDATGHYAFRVPADAVISSVSVWRGGFLSSDETGDPVVAMDGGDRTHDVSLTPDWAGARIGAGAGLQDPACLTHPNDWGDSVELGGRTLRITSDGIVTDWSTSPLDARNTGAGLVPFAPSASGPSWGVSDGSLCVQWTTPDGPVYQVWMTPTGDGEYDVTYNYDTIPTSPSSARAGWSDGRRSFGERVVLDGAGAGYADDVPTGLIHHSLGSDRDGRYAFHFTGFAATGDAPHTWGTRIGGARAVGGTLTAQMRSWWFEDSEEAIPAADLTFHYRWHRGTTTLGTDPTYVAQGSDFGRTVVLDVDALVAGHQVGTTSARTVIRIGDAAAVNNEAPAITPTSPEVGALLTVSTGSWTPRDGLTADDLTYTYRWFRNGHRISGAEDSTYQLTDRDAGKQVSADVTAASAPYGSVTAAAPAVTAPQLPQLTATTVPTISGDPKVGETLTLDPGDWGEGTTLSYQWYVGWRQRATGTSYTLTSSDVGEYVTAVVTARATGHVDGRGSVVVGPVVRADAQTRTLTVHVVDDETGNPVAGAWVYACEEEDWTCLPARATDESGTFTATGLAGRQYSISVYPDEPYRSGNGTISEGGDGSTTIRLTQPTPPPPNVEIPSSNGTFDGMPVVFWQQDQDFNLTGCATTANPTYTVTFSDGTPTRSGALTKQGEESGGIATFHATIPAFYPSHGEITITTNVPATCAPGAPATTINVYIDPSGTVTDQYGRGIGGATVTLLRSDAAGGPYVAVPNESPIMSEANNANPSVADDTGFFHWDVSEGWYRVKAEAPGCTTATTDAMQVPPPRVDLVVKLQCAGATAPTATPEITGTPALGSTLTTTTDIWDPALDDDVSVQWLRDGVAIEGATGTTYQVVTADRGHDLTVRETARRTTYTQEEGRGAPVTFTAVSATSAAASVPGGNLAAPTASAPSLTGGSTHRVGDTLGFVAPTWSLAGVTTTQEWYVDHVATGVTTATFPLTAQHAGRQVFVRLTGHLAGHDNGTVDSPTVTVAPGAAPTASVAPAISGTPQVGQTLTAAPGTWSATGLAFGYQWQRAGSAISGATGATYQPTADDVGKAITVAVTATRSGYEAGHATSAGVTVAQRTSTVVLTAPKSVKAGKKATFTAKVTVAGVVGPTGAVTLLDGKKAIGTVTLAAPAKGVATFVVKKLKPGKHLLTAVYAGSADTAGSTSKPVSVKVGKPKKKARIMLQRTALARMQQVV